MAALAVGLVASAAVTTSTDARAAQQQHVKAPHQRIFAGDGFDGCQTPDTGTMRAWLGSPYRAMNFYIPGAEALASDCAVQAELTGEWVTTVTSNGWSLLPTYVGRQAPCATNTTLTSSQKISTNTTTARSQGVHDADLATSFLSGIEVTAPNPVYVDIEPYDTKNARCTKAVVAFVDGWTTELHGGGFTAGVYAHHTLGLVPIATKTSPKPDDVWFADWNGNDTTSESALSGSAFKGHRVHQYAAQINNEHSTYNGAAIQIDKDAVHADVVGVVKPAAPVATSDVVGTYYAYVASPPHGATLKARDAPSPNGNQQHAFNYGDEVDVVCQAVGDPADVAGSTVHGDPVWDEVVLGPGQTAYVSDLYVTTTGGLSFTAGLPRCDTTAPAAAGLRGVPATTLPAHRSFTFSGSDTDSGVGRFTVRVRRARWNSRFGSWHVAPGGAAVPAAGTQSAGGSYRLAVAPGYDYCVEARAVDRSGNAGPWSSAHCTARPLDDRTFSAGTGWSRRSSKHGYLGTITRAISKGRQLTVRHAEVDRVGVVATTCAKCGRIAVRVGGRTIGTLNLHSARTHYRVLFLLPTFSLRTDPIHLVTTTRHEVDVDGVLLSRT